MPYPPATLTGAGWIVDPIVNPKSGVPSPTPPYVATLGGGGWVVDPIPKPNELPVQVAALFAAMSGPKLWLDPSDTATRFQDYAGTSLVTADGQAFARLNDKSGAGNHIGQSVAGVTPVWKTDGTLSWAQPDGVDDFWQSLAPLDLSTTDKITVIAGVRKTTDANLQMVAEFSANAGSTAGTFWILGGDGSVGATGWHARAGGTTRPLLRANSAAAPISAVLTLADNIAGPSEVFRVNGTVIASTGSTQGTGNFSSAPLYLLSRSGGALPSSVYLYGLMIFGRLLTADELSLCERYMAQKSGVTI